MDSCLPSGSPWRADLGGIRVRVIDKVIAAADAGNARARWPARHCVVLVLTDAEGRIGLGEASPLPGLSLESAPRARAELVRLAAGDHSGVPSMCPSARFALDSALLDLRGQHEGKPIWALLRDDPAPASLACNALVSTRPDSWRDRVAAHIEAGARCIKLKIGFSDLAVEAEIDAVRALLEALPAGTHLRLDANGAYTAHDAWRLRTALADERIEYVEDPVHAAALGTPTRDGLDWAADRLLLEAPDTVERCGPQQGLAALILKPTLLGAVHATLARVQAARARGVDAVFTHCFEGAIGHAAIVQLAYATAGPAPRAMGLADHDALQPWPSRLSASQRPSGTGLGLDPSAVLEWLDRDA